MRLPSELESDSIQQAAHDVRVRFGVTPLVQAFPLTRQFGGQVLLKAENLQRSGSFKIRGALSKLRSLPPDVLARGVVTYSSGNHGQALALCARIFGIPCTVVMPEGAVPAKVEATRKAGAEIVIYGRSTEDRKEKGLEIATERGQTIVPSFDDLTIVRGQGTIAVEIIEACPDVRTIVCPIGGGGLISGIAAYIKQVSPQVRVVGVEPAAAADTKASLQAGERVRIEPPATVADGLAAVMPGKITFPLMQQFVDDVVLASEDEILGGLRFCYKECRLVVEPSGAASVGAILYGKVKPAPYPIIAIVSGGNVNWERLPGWLAG